MSVVNVFFFSAAYTLLSKSFKIDSSDKLFWLSMLSLYFMTVPYSEALFCLLIAAALYGIVKNIKWLVWVSLFLVSMSRATAVFLIPALLVMELLSNRKKDIFYALKSYLLQYALPVMIGTFTFVLIQYYYTGQWFIYYKVQVKNLGHEFSWPVLPFVNFYGSNRILWLSALAMVPCLLSIIIILPKIYNWVLKNKVYTDKIWLLTLTYFPIILFTMVFYNPKWGDNRTNLLGIHRYVLCSPFIFIFLHYTIGQLKIYQARHYVIMFFVCNLVWLSVGSWWHLEYLLFYNCLTLMVLAYMYHSGRKNHWAAFLLFAVNLFLQINLYQQFLSGAFTD